jgi:hypothetical protein
MTDIMKMFKQIQVHWEDLCGSVDGYYNERILIRRDLRLLYGFGLISGNTYAVTIG